jgi:hypothetical protein
MNKLTLLAAAALATVVSATPPAHAAEAYATYEDFTGDSRIDTTKFLFPERQRNISGGKLNMLMREYGTQLADTNFTADSWGLNIERGPEKIRWMRATVTAKSFSVTGCGTNPEPSDVQARLIGAFFNVGATPPADPNNRIGDVVATVRLIRYSDSADASTVLRAEGTVARCTTADCNLDTEELGRVDLGPVTVGTAATLAMEWQPGNNRFAFQLNANAKKLVAYTVPDAQPPARLFRQVGLRTRLANCFGGPRTQGFVNASFDNLQVNSSALQ